MASRPGRLEVAYPAQGKPRYYIVRDARPGSGDGRVRRLIGSGDAPPSAREVEQLSREFAFDMEVEAAMMVASMSAATFRAELLSEDELHRLEEMRHVHKAFRGYLTAEELDEWDRYFEAHYVHGTTWFEGTPMTLEETFRILDSGEVPSQRSLRDINAVQNYIAVKRFRDGHRGRVSVDAVLQLHSLIMRNISDEPGEFRRLDGISVMGCDLRASPAKLIPERLDEMIDSYYASLDDSVHPFEAAALFHCQFEMAHPFPDGNGRVGRELFNMMLSRERFPRILFLKKEREKYLAALTAGGNGRLSLMASVLCDMVTSQRMDLLVEELKRASAAPDGQTRLDDFQGGA